MLQHKHSENLLDMDNMSLEYSDGKGNRHATGSGDEKRVTGGPINSITEALVQVILPR